MSIITEKRSYDFYGTDEKSILLWVDRLKNIADENNRKRECPFPYFEVSSRINQNSLHSTNHDLIGKQSNLS